MNIKKRILSIVSAAIFVVSISSISAFATTKKTISSIGTKSLTVDEGLDLDDVQNEIEKHISIKNVSIDADSATCSELSSGKTKDGKTYLVEDVIATAKSGYEFSNDEDECKFNVRIRVDDESEISKSKATITYDGVAGKSKSDVLAIAVDKFEDNHFDVSASDFDQDGTPTLSSTTLTQKGQSYKFVCDDVDTESGYSCDASKLVFTYTVSGTSTTSTTTGTGTATTGDYSGWTNITSVISNAQSGNVLIKMNGEQIIPQTAIAAVKGKNVNLILDFGTYAWTINGLNVSVAQVFNFYITQDTTEISSSAVTSLAGSRSTKQMKLTYSGLFGFSSSLTIMTSSEQAGQYANLYYYNPATQKFEFQSSGLISTAGYANLRFNNAPSTASYVIVVNSTPMA